MNTVKSTLLQIIKRKESPLFLVLFIAGLSLLGWIFGKVIFASISSAYIPIAPSTAIIFIILSSRLFLKNKIRESPIIQSFNTALVALVVLFCLNVILNYFFNFPWDIENTFIKNPNSLGNVPIGRMSPITALLFIFICIGLLSSRQKNTKIIKYIGGSLALLVFLVSSILLIGYLYKTPLLYGSTIIPIALPTAICLFLFSITLLRICELKFWTLNLIEGNTVTLQLLKLFLPIVVLAVIVEGFLITNFPISHNNPTLSIAIILFIVLAVIVFVVIKVSGNIGDKLHRAEQEIKDSEARLEYAMQATDSGVWDWNIATNEEYFSHRWCEIIGYSFDDKELEHTYSSWAKRIHPDDYNMLMKQLDMHLNEGTPYNVDYRHLHKSGEYRWQNSTGKAIRNESGKPIQMIGRIIDVTERKKSELALKESEIKLRQLNVDKDRFILILGHDLKTPFNNILGFSDVLTTKIDTLNPDKIKEIAGNINKSARITNKLLEDILMWARTQQGSIPFKPQKLSLSATCKNILEILNPSAEAKNITIYDSSVDHINVYADADMFKTIVLNLVSNAIKFTNSGGKININAKQHTENVTISVSDNGVGIRPEDLTKLFNISEVLTTKGTTGETGTGLGLLLCKEFVDKHGGKIWVESEEDKGSVFYFTIPNNNKPDEVSVVKNVISADAVSNQITNLKILITDDDESSRKLLGFTVKAFAKEILYAQNGFEAVVACHDNPDIDLILMDIKMPVMDGFEATRQIRQPNKEVIIIVQTAYANSNEKEKAEEAGCNDFISKPINKTLFKELIKKHCKK